MFTLTESDEQSRRRTCVFYWEGIAVLARAEHQLVADWAPERTNMEFAPYYSWPFFYPFNESKQQLKDFLENVYISCTVFQVTWLALQRFFSVGVLSSLNPLEANVGSFNARMFIFFRIKCRDIFAQRSEHSNKKVTSRPSYPNCESITRVSKQLLAQAVVRSGPLQCRLGSRGLHSARPMAKTLPQSLLKSEKICRVF